MAISWQEIYKNKIVPTDKALSHIRNGQTIVISTGCGEPVLLTQTLAEMANQFSDIQVIQILSQIAQRLGKPEYASSFSCNSFGLRRGVEASAHGGMADYTPINIRELHTALEKGIVSIDVALISVSPPGADAQCSLGISVDITKAAVNKARLVIAQINTNMPVTSGDSHIPVDKIDYMVPGDSPLIEVNPPELDPMSLTIGRHIANMISDGRTLHFDRSVISSAAMRYLDSKKNLGIHTDIFTDDYLRLIKSGAVTNRKKTLHTGKSVATMAIGSNELYEEIDQNPDIELYPIEYANDPHIISKHDNMLSVLSIQYIDLSGIARFETDTLSEEFSILSCQDFNDGTRLAKNGLVIMALYSTTHDGEKSRIVPLISGKGEYYSRTKVDIVVTEYGSVSLYGRSVRERAIGLISIAHPKFRDQLLEEAKKLQYVDEKQIISPESGCIYPSHYEFTHRFDDGLEIFFRPVKPLDAKGLQKMFYTLSEETIRMRYHGTIKSLSNGIAQGLANIDYNKDMAILGLVGPRRNPRIIAEARYSYNPTNNMGDFDILVTEEFRSRGIGRMLANYLKKIAYSNGLSGLYCEILASNQAGINIFTKAWPTAHKSYEAGVCTFTIRFPEQDVERPKDSILVYSGRFNEFSYGEGHPFRPDRAKFTLDLMLSEGYLNEPWIRQEEPITITKEVLYESHNPDFIDALEAANSGEWNDSFLAFHLGGDECPVFKGLFDYVMLYTAATLTGVNLITQENANLAFNPLGGFHHAHRDYAEGFCYVNDVVAAIDSFLSKGLRVACIDIDAHHGNGVQDAYYSDDRVMTISTHQTGKSLFPWSGFEYEIGKGNGRGYNINIPLPEETDDEAFLVVFDQLINTVMEQFQPNVVISIIGGDTHKNDPLTGLNLTNNGMAETIERIREYSSHLLLLGGGGYDIASTSKAWSRMWAAANRINAMPDYLTVMGGTFLGAEGLKGATLIDRSFIVSGDTKKEIHKEIDLIIQFHVENTLPLIKFHHK